MRLGALEFDAKNLVLSRDGAAVALSHRAVQLLDKLATSRGETVSKAELLEAAWPGMAIEESNLTVQIAALRKALGPTPEGGEWIVTVPRIGYRLLGERANAAETDDELKPSIAVMPFANMSSDSEQDYFAAGLSEDLITDLSKVPGLSVIARSSSFAIKDSFADPQAVGRDLQVRYIVQGSVRRAADRVRINVQLVDVGERIAIWADRFDGEVADVFALQDEVVRRIVKALSDVLPSARVPRARRATSLEAYDLFARGRSLVMQSAEGSREGRALLLQATELDPGFPDAHAWIAMSLIHGWLNWGLPMISLEQARMSAQRAVELDPTDVRAHAMLGHVFTFERRFEESQREFAETIRLNPTDAESRALHSEELVALGKTAEAVAAAEMALKLNPYPPHWYHWMVALAYYADGRYADAAAALEHESTLRTPSQRIRAASLAQLGRIEEAREIAEGFLAHHPGFRIADWIAAQPLPPDIAERFAEGYRMAGLPD